MDVDKIGFNVETLDGMTLRDYFAGQAFPACNEANMNGTLGMTLRDYFAGQAPEIPEYWNSELYIGEMPSGTIFPYSGPSLPPAELIEMDRREQRLLSDWYISARVAWSYAYADEMLEARK